LYVRGIALALLVDSVIHPDGLVKWVTRPKIAPPLIGSVAIGDRAVAHKPDEHVSEAQMAKCDRMLDRLVEKLSK
jgi:hypothetical protein